MRQAQLSKKIVFWLNTINGDIKMGLPEQYSAPDYHEKIICGTVQEAEKMSQKMRDQEREREMMAVEMREEKEEKLRSEHRSHLNHLMANASNNLNRDFLRGYVNKNLNRPNDPTAVRRESFLHSEGYEHGS